MKYKSKGLLLFAYGKEGELYTRKWDMKALTKNLSSNSEKEDFQEIWTDKFRFQSGKFFTYRESFCGTL